MSSLIAPVLFFQAQHGIAAGRIADKHCGVCRTRFEPVAYQSAAELMDVRR